MRKIFKIISVLSVMLLLTFTMVAAENNNGQYIEAEAVLYPNGQDANAMSVVVDQLAFRNLAIQADELHITSETTIRDVKLESDVIKTKVATAIRGAKIVSKVRNADGSFRAVARLPIFGVGNSLASAVLPENIQTEDLPKPKTTNLSGSIENYTGLIIDCRGKNITNAIAPAIKSADGTIIYSYKNVSRQLATEKGIISYSDSIDSNSQIVGSKPLTITASSVSNNCDVIVSNEDADRILIANESSKFLNNCMVVIVR